MRWLAISEFSSGFTVPAASASCALSIMEVNVIKAGGGGVEAADGLLVIEPAESRA
jgi:hypothetical protein